jgi:phosphoglycolate phosphatase
MLGLIFDLDGTLIDSAPGIQAAVNRMLEEQGEAALDLPTVTSFIGNGLPKLVERVMRHIGADLAAHKAWTDITLRYYTEAPDHATVLYPHVIEALKGCRAAGMKLAICTNKPYAPAIRTLEQFDLTKYFDFVIGGDSLPVNKPDPQMCFEAVKALGCAQNVFIGDTAVDAETAERAGLAFFYYTPGYGTARVAQFNVFTEFSDYREFCKLIKGYCRD